jgi:hypothetical protein
MDEADVKFQLAAAIVPQVGIAQPEFAAVTADACAGI